MGYTLLLAFLIFVLTNYYLEKKEQKMLNNYFTTTAIVLEIHQPQVIHDSYSGTFQYEVGGKIYKFTEVGNFSFLKLGDTVEIKYAKENHAIAKVIDKFYMSKYRNLKNSF